MMIIRGHGNYKPRSLVTIYCVFVSWKIDNNKYILENDPRLGSILTPKRYYINIIVKKNVYFLRTYQLSIYSDKACHGM